MRYSKHVNGEFTLEYVELPNGRMSARDFVDSPDGKAAARIDAFSQRLRVYGNWMQGKFVKKLTHDPPFAKFAKDGAPFPGIFRTPIWPHADRSTRTAREQRQNPHASEKRSVRHALIGQEPIEKAV